MILLVGLTIVVACAISASPLLAAQVPDWVVYPDEEWQTITAEEAGVEDVAAWDR